MMMLVGSQEIGADPARRESAMSLMGKSGGWYAVNDSVMGGVSLGNAVIDDSGVLLFSGAVSFENNGGFASIRHDAAIFGLSHSRGASIRVRGDGRTYQFRVVTRNGFRETTYKYTFETIKDRWQSVEMRWDHFVATYRGRLVPDAPALDSGLIRRLGFLIADRQEGPFRLEIASIGPL